MVRPTVGALRQATTASPLWHGSCETIPCRASRSTTCCSEEEEWVMTENDGYMKFLPAGLVAIVLGIAAILLLRRPRKPRSFREDPVGALKDRGEIVASKAQEATEEALARIQ